MNSPRDAGAPKRRPDSRPSTQTAIIQPYAPAEQSLGVVSRTTGYRMIESFEIENFRCFESLKLGDLKRINIITGENASGKTALLEAILAAGRGTPEGLLALNQMRGIVIGQSVIAGLPPTISNIQFPSLWNHWFHTSAKKNTQGVDTITTATKMSFRFSDSDHKNYACDFSYDPEKSAAPQTPLAISSVAPFNTHRTVSERQKPKIQTSNSIGLGPQGQLQGAPLLENLGPAVFFFNASMNYAESDNVMWFSQLRQKGEAGEIIEFFKRNFSFIQGLEVLQPTAGTPPGIYATLTSGSVRRMQAISSGIHKISSILLGCAQSSKGIVLVDEIENGIFYDKYALTWYILNKFSKDHQCQLFITSHSAECLQKLVQIIGDDVDDFSLLRTERENGKCVVRHIGGASMKAALKRGGEVRGGGNGTAKDH